jgi:serine/threonine-protein kinase
MAQPPQRIGKYVIDSVLGRGGMGEVYKAHDENLGRYVALKIMRGPSMDDAIARERFIREAQAAGGLRHPNIVTIYDLGEVEGQMYIAMEFIKGDDLEKIIKGRAALSIEDKLNIMIQVCEGVSYAHKNQIVHRDLKPSNIRIDDEGVVKIMDFGIAKMESSNMTASGTVLGTPFYMSPEQVRGIRVDARSDVFALGAILYEVFTFEKAFPGDMASVFYKIVHEQPVPLAKYMNVPSESLQNIVNVCLEKDKSKRLQTAAEMANLLRDSRKWYRDQNSQTVIGLPQTVQVPSPYHIAPAPTAVESDTKRPNTNANVSTQMTTAGQPTVLGGFPTSVDAGPSTRVDPTHMIQRPQPSAPVSQAPVHAQTGTAAPAAPAASSNAAIKILGILFALFAFMILAGGAFYYFVIYDPDKKITNGDDKKDDIPKVDYSAELAQAKSLYLDKKYEEAAAIYAKILEKNPEDAEVHFLMGAAKQQMLKNQEALMEYQRAVELDPKKGKAWQQIGFILMERMDYAKAENSFLKAIQIDPESGANWQGLAQTYMIMQEFDKAQNAYEKLLSLEPNNDSANYNIGIIYMGKKDFSSAKRSFLKTIEINPNFAEAHNNLGLTYLQEGEVDQSIQQNEMAIALKPNLYSAHYQLFLAYEQKGDLKIAGRHLRKYVEITGENDPALLQKLKEYGG